MREPQFEVDIYPKIQQYGTLTVVFYNMNCVFPVRDILFINDTWDPTEN